MTAKLETDYILFELEDNLLFATYKKGNRINLDIAKQIVRDRVAFVKGRPVVALIMNHGVISIDKDARAYFTSDEGVSGINAVAILYETPATAMLGNFIISVNRPKLPARLFSKKDKAIGWLRTKA